MDAFNARERQKELLKQEAIEYYKAELARMFSDKDIDYYIGNGHIIKYADLANYRTINELLPNDGDYCVILLEQKENSGHWTALLKYKNIIESFDSYGCRPQYGLKFVSTYMKQLLGQTGNLLINLLRTKSKGQEVYYNKRQLQQINDNVNTCGRWCVARIESMKMGLELDEFINKVDSKCKATDKPPDIICVDWVPTPDFDRGD